MVGAYTGRRHRPVVGSHGAHAVDGRLRKGRHGTERLRLRPFTGGLGVHYGARRIGANILPISSGNTRRQLHVMRDFGTTLLTCTPSYSLFLAEAAREEGIDFRDMPLKAGCFGAEPWSENMRVEIEPARHQRARHLWPDRTDRPRRRRRVRVQARPALQRGLFYPEIINPETGEVLPDGEKGELVITSLERAKVRRSCATARATSPS